MPPFSTAEGSAATGGAASTEAQPKLRLLRSSDAALGQEEHSETPKTPSRTPLRVDQALHEGFSLVSYVQGDALVIRFRGRGEMDAVQLLEECLKKVHRDVLRLAVTQLKFDFSELYSLNPRCVRTFVSWIVPLSKGAPPPYRIILLGNPKLSWQSRSLNSLRYLAPGLVTIEVAGAK